MQKKILIVEDEYEIASTMAQVLEMEEFEVRLATNGLEALAFLSSESMPDLIISDVMMPFMDGYAFTQLLRADKRFDTIPLLLTSAGRLDDNKIDPKLVQGFIRKPFDLYYFLDIIKINLEKL